MFGLDDFFAAVIIGAVIAGATYTMTGYSAPNWTPDSNLNCTVNSGAKCTVYSDWKCTVFDDVF